MGLGLGLGLRLGLRLGLGSTLTLTGVAQRGGDVAPALRRPELLVELPVRLHGRAQQGGPVRQAELDPVRRAHDGHLVRGDIVEI